MRNFVRVVMLAAVLCLSFPLSGQANPDQDFSDALGAIDQGNFPKAVELLSRILAAPEGIQKKNLMSAYNVRALCYAQLGQNDNALADFNKALEIDPKNAEILGNRAFVWQAMGNLDNAKADAKAAKRIDFKVKVPEF
ncbi:tetratricopeptide repeat protein [Desulfolutivibrio sulfoxidireducens]|uniref:tetratricopeptide repeat protein n=1 Tax=Desulfolutivibrio sulfoxidireducens TaxID=2773299 RepID=UPI00159D4BBC|nr:tetratricopeptide repeat protein [Desulfolutivibrio sulfoxidireducens]QLA16299.1 tetratricopeptide repeat protein [Desulfolutivibrio sulfoxidireducens]QLA19809.1 tetratricopeptide repeat protein [Desulfolutivibrio sulfoxidireducens]